MRTHGLGVWAATAMVVTEVVGVGIFLTPAIMMRTLGSVRPALAVRAGAGGVPEADPGGTLSADALAASMIAAFFAFGGWWELGRMSEEVESPRRTMPWALVGGVALVTAIYALVGVAFVLVAPVHLRACT